MLLTPFPFDYVVLVDPGDRLRRTRARGGGSRVRRPPAGSRS
jgi:hypothetical protein